MFKQFLLESEKLDLKNTLNSIPKSHKALLKDYKFKFQGNNTLKGDNQHVGELDPNNKKITVAAPWRYSRELTILHELAHLVWEKLNNQTKKEWSKLIKDHGYKEKVKNKAALNQNPEEIFCMVYGSAYSKNPVETFNHPKWIEFIKNIKLT